MSRRCWHLALVAAGLGPQTAWAGPEWEEMGEAGSEPSTAQTTKGSGSMSKIRGKLGTSALAGNGTEDFEDMYLIRIVDAGGFSARTTFIKGGPTSFNTQLWLFGLDGRGLLGNDDAPDLGGPGSLLLNQANDMTGIQITEGTYYLAITGFDNRPFSLNPGTGLVPIFDQGLPQEISGPDGLGGEFRFEDWVPGTGEVGDYEIDLTGVTFARFVCAGDTNDDNVVDIQDLTNVILHWGTEDPGADLNDDGVVDVQDLTLVILNWGPCKGSCPAPGDCFLGHDNPGCQDAACCSLVCAFDPFCCNWQWDDVCAGIALQLCGGPKYACNATPESPVNDCCDPGEGGGGPTKVTGMDTTLSFDTTAARTDGPDDPTNPCLSALDDSQIWKDVWYLYNAPANGQLVVSVCFAPTNFDTKIIAYDVPGGVVNCNALLENTIACNEDCEPSAPFRSELVFPVTAGESYLIRLGGFSPTSTEPDAASGPGDISFTLMPTKP